MISNERKSDKDDEQDYERGKFTSEMFSRTKAWTWESCTSRLSGVVEGPLAVISPKPWLRCQL